MAAFSPVLPLTVAYSGGADSSALLLACARRNGWCLRALHKHLGERLWLDGLQGAIMLLKGSVSDGANPLLNAGEGAVLQDWWEKG